MKIKTVVVLISAVLVVIFLSWMVYHGMNTDSEVTQPISSPEDMRLPVQVEEHTPMPEVIEEHTPIPDVMLEPTVTAQQSMHLVAVGDIMLGRGVDSRIRKQAKDYTYPFLEVSSILQQGDIVFGNLEHPLTDRTRGLAPVKKGVEGGKYVLKCRTEAIEGLKYAGFNLLSLANNHILDFYEEGLYDTFEILDKANVAYAGAGKDLRSARKPARLECQGIQVGMLAYTDFSQYTYRGTPSIRFAAEENKSGVAPLNEASILEDIAAQRDTCDILIVSLHWGVEESFGITEAQQALAHKIMDAGADVILGHHPHQFQGIEIYKGKPIVYSLGNFIFDQNDLENQESFIVEMDFTAEGLVQMEAVPIRIVDKIRVIPIQGESAKELLNRQKELCAKLGAYCDIVNDKIVFDLE